MHQNLLFVPTGHIHTTKLTAMLRALCTSKTSAQYTTLCLLSGRASRHRTLYKQTAEPCDWRMHTLHFAIPKSLCPEAHMDMILFEVFFKNIHLIPQDQIVQWHYL